MKKFLLALTAVASMTGVATAADLGAARPYAKAPVAVPVAASWTGCYVGAGGGGAYTTNDHNDVVFPSGVAMGPNVTTGARGWFGTVQAGCDYQFNNFVVGAFGDYDFMDVKGDISMLGFGGPAIFGTQKQDSQWSVGGRIGYLVFPQLLTYFSGGYTQAHWKSTDMFNFGVPAPAATLTGFTKGGWFIGTGDEYAVNFLPGLFWKTEYRYSEFDRATQGVTVGGVQSGVGLTEKLREHSVRSELVYRFNWGGSVVAKY